MSRSGAALVAVATLCLRLAVAAPAEAAAPNTWHVAATLSLGTEDTAISCPTSTTCWAVEAGQLISSADGGASWTSHTEQVPADVAALNDLTCPAARVCYLTATLQSGGPKILVLRNGGLSARSVPATGPLPTITCSTATRCLTSDGHTVYVTTDGATSWTQHGFAQIVYSNVALSCVPTTTRCWVVGDNGETPLIERTTNFGTTWTAEHAPGDTDGLHGVSCPATSQPVAQTSCYAVGSDFPDYAVVIRTVDGGASWTFAQVPTQGYPLRSVSCPSATQCTAIGYSPGRTPFVFTTTNGKTWTSQPIQPVQTDQPAAISCPITDHCAAVASGVAFSTDSGGSWVEVDVAAALEAPSSLACGSAKACVGVGNDSAGRPFAITTADAGTTWTRVALPDGTGRMGDVDCPSAEFCYAMAVVDVPGSAQVSTQALSSTDGGATWQLDRVNSPNGSVAGLSCPSTTTCIAGGYDNRSRTKLLLTTNSGATWKLLTAPDPGNMSGFACGSLTSCTLLYSDSSGNSTAWVTYDLGTTYQSHPVPPGEYFGMDCSSGTCVAAGADVSGNGIISVSTNGGVTWNRVSVPAAAQLIFAVSCGSATACAASSYDFREGGGPQIVGTTDSGARWTSYSIPARPEQPIAVTCVRVSCLASDVSDAGNPLVLAGRA